MKIFISISILVSAVAFSAHAQEKKGMEIDVPTVIKNTTIDKTITIEFADVFNTQKIELPFANTPTVVLQNVQKKQITNYKLGLEAVLPKSITPIVAVATERKQPIAYIQVPKYYQELNGTVWQVIQFDVQTTNGAPIKQTRGNRTYAANSVFNTGDWYKIAIETRGIHKIDFDFVKNKIGVTPSTINVSQIGLFGNGGEMLAEDNRVLRADDVTQNPIQLVGMQDGSWDASDYILFYANGPFSIIADSIDKQFHHAINLYENKSYYFLNFATPNAKRINTAAPITQPVTNTISTCDEFLFTEIDSTNIGNFGKRWWGQKFGNGFNTVLQRNFDFTVPNIITDAIPATVGVALGGTSFGVSSSFEVNVNNLAAGNVLLPSLGKNYYDPAYREGLVNAIIQSPTNDNINVKVNFLPGRDNAEGYLDWIEINAKRTLQTTSNQFFISNFDAKGPNNITKYQIQNANNSWNVWNITNQLLPYNLPVNLVNTTAEFVVNNTYFQKFIAFTGANFTVPSFIKKIENQNLHALANKQYLIVTAPQFLGQAQKLAQHHAAKRGTTYAIATTEQVYNEFSSGGQDISAIRDFAKMFYDKASSVAEMPKNLLLFGDASFDYKDRVVSNTNFVPSRETDESADKIRGYVSDDFFGMLDDGEYINGVMPNTLDIGVGRLTASDADEADIFLQKIFIYDSSASFGDWKNSITLCADNNDGSIHAMDGEVMSNVAADSMPVFNQQKVYIDAFPLAITPGGNRSPQAKQSLDAQIFNGTFVVNYNGHGGPDAWCDERIFTTADIPNYQNLTKLPLYITATCDFGPFNVPSKKSAAEKLLNYSKGGAIALMTTTQLVFQYENRIMNADYWKKAFSPNKSEIISLGEAYRRSKNETYLTSTFDLSNFRKFALLGDPALPLCVPSLTMQVDSLNGKSIAANPDTLKALNVCILKGSITNAAGVLQSNFTGTADITIYDKVKKIATLGNTPESPVMDYKLQTAVIFKGKASVENGLWKLKFVVPKDIDYNYGFGKISMYAANQTVDANGFEKRIVIGGSSNTNIIDNAGPIIKLFMNNEKFINGGITGPNSILLANLEDENGINTSGNSIGHDITAVLDANTTDPTIVNNFYTVVKDDYTKGIIRFPYKNLSPGKHTITLKAWDVLNNSSTATIDFVVQANTTAQLENILNYPNPFTTHTTFSFEHNYPGELLYVTVEIYSVNGSMVKSIRKVIATDGSRVEDVDWDGKDEYGDPIGKGVYLYKLHYKTQSGKSAAKYQKLIKL